MQNRSLLSWLRPIIFGHIFFIIIITLFSFRLVDKPLLNQIWIFSLFYEGNIGVWWSGFCLFIAALLFYRLFSLAHNNYDRLMWFVISMMLVTLCLDEVASFHERAHLYFGWTGLGIIGLTGLILLSFSIVRLYKNNHSFWTPSLILISLFLFVAVAGLEYIEHNFRFDTKFINRLRSVSEEGIELIATTLFLVSAYLEFKRNHQHANPFTLIPNPSKMPFIKEGLLALLILQLGFLLYFNLEYVPVFDKTRVRGYLVFWLPMACYMLCACFFLNNATTISLSKRVILSTIFLLASIGSLFNLSYLYFTFVDNTISLSLLDSFVFKTAFLTVPLILAFLWLDIKSGLKMALLCAILILLIYPRQEFRDGFYFLTSILGFYSFSSLYFLMQKRYGV